MSADAFARAIRPPVACGTGREGSRLQLEARDGFAYATATASGMTVTGRVGPSTGEDDRFSVAAEDLLRATRSLGREPMVVERDGHFLALNCPGAGISVPVASDPLPLASLPEYVGNPMPLAVRDLSEIAGLRRWTGDGCWEWVTVRFTPGRCLTTCGNGTDFLFLEKRGRWVGEQNIHLHAKQLVRAAPVLATMDKDATLEIRQSRVPHQVVASSDDVLIHLFRDPLRVRWGDLDGQPASYRERAADALVEPADWSCTVRMADWFPQWEGLRASSLRAGVPPRRTASVRLTLNSGHFVFDALGDVKVRRKLPVVDVAIRAGKADLTIPVHIEAFDRAIMSFRTSDYVQIDRVGRTLRIWAGSGPIVREADQRSPARGERRAALLTAPPAEEP